MGTLTDYPCSFRTGRRDSGTFVLTYSRYTSVSPLYRREEGMETFVAIRTVHRGVFCTWPVAGYTIAVRTSDESRYGNRCNRVDRSGELASERKSRAYKG